MKTSPSYLAHVDGLRALAVLAVMLYHLDPALLPGGFVGVDVFFVISGYVVTASLAGHRGEPLHEFLGRFYARRLARLAPALALMLVVTTLLYVLFVPRTWFNHAAESVGQAAFLGLSNWVLDRQAVNYFEPRAELNPFTHTWSLGVEEQFYLLAPVVLFLALGHRAGASGRRLGVVLIAALAAVSFLAAYAFGFSKGSRFVFYQLGFRFWELGAGALLFLGQDRLAALEPRAGVAARASGWVGLALVLLAMGLPKPSAYPWIRATLAVAGTLLLIGLPASNPGLRSVLASRLAVWLGLRSYALYLWHWPLYVLARWTSGLNLWPFNLFTVAISVAAAALSYRLVENPVRFSQRLASWRPSARIASMLLMLMLGWWVGDALLAAQPVLGLGQAARQAPDWYPDRRLLKTTLAAARACEPVVKHSPVGEAKEAQTTFSATGCSRRAEAQFFVLGDSHATAYLPLLEQLSAEQGRTVIVLQVPGCSYIDLMAPMVEATDGHCTRLAHASMHTVLTQARPGDIVFLPSLRLPRLIHLGGQRRAAGNGETYARSPAELLATEQATADAPRWFEPFIAAGLRVVFELPKPVFRAHPFACVDAFTRHNPACVHGLVENRTDQEHYRKPVVGALRQLARHHPALVLWDPLPLLCDGSTCPAVQGGRPLFFDGDHLSPYGNLTLLPALRALVDDLAPRSASTQP